MRLAVFVCCFWLSVSLAQAQLDETNHWDGFRCAKANRKQFKVGKKNAKKGKCYFLTPPKYHHAVTTVKVLKATESETCAGSTITIKDSDTFDDNAATDIAQNCTPGATLQIDSLDGDTNMLSFWTYKAEAKLVTRYVKCQGEPGCPMPPTRAPTRLPTAKPTRSPTPRPTTKEPTARPTKSPTRLPTRSPTLSPTKNPTTSPTVSPTTSPTNSPTRRPTRKPTDSPTPPTLAPTKNPTNPCDVVDAEQTNTFTGDSYVADTDVERCWRFTVSVGKFMRVFLSARFPDGSVGCTNDFVQLMENNEAASVRLCGDENGDVASAVSQDSTSNELVLRVSTDAFIPGGSFSMTWEVVDEDDRVTPTTCSEEECIREALLDARRGKVTPESADSPGVINETIIEIDQDVVLLKAPLLVADDVFVTIRPAAGRSSIVLDGMKHVGILRAGRNSIVKVVNVKFQRGFAQASWGGAIAAAGELHLKGCQFENNFADHGGGAVFLHNNKVHRSSIHDCVFDSNLVLHGNGGAVHLVGGSLEFAGNQFAGNGANDGSVCFAQESQVSLYTENTYARNTARNVFALEGTILNVFNQAPGTVG